MAEKPILFSTPMVRAITEGRKTQTRRVVKPQPSYIFEEGLYINGKGVVFFGKETSILKYKAGDLLWVREAFASCSNGDFLYRADPVFDDCNKSDIAWDWKPSIFMPREASRIMLEVKRVCVEQLQHIVEKDAQAEGVIYGQGQRRWTARSAFMDTWDSINEKRGYSWESNPWVMVVEFRRVK